MRASLRQVPGKQSADKWLTIGSGWGSGWCEWARTVGQWPGVVGSRPPVASSNWAQNPTTRASRPACARVHLRHAHVARVPRPGPRPPASRPRWDPPAQTCRCYGSRGTQAPARTASATAIPSTIGSRPAKPRAVTLDRPCHRRYGAKRRASPLRCIRHRESRACRPAAGAARPAASNRGALVVGRRRMRCEPVAEGEGLPQSARDLRAQIETHHAARRR
jgi:hypothetical protein